MNTPMTALTLAEIRQDLPLGYGTADKRFEHFWNRVDLSGECWPWTASRFDTGYGCVWWDGRAQKAHRVAWSLIHGPIPAGTRILHRCDNPPCCRPSHLFAGTMRDNTADMVAKGRHGRDGRRHLTAEVIPFIRERYAAGGVSLKQLADEHGVTFPAIWKVVHRKSWREVA